MVMLRFLHITKPVRNTSRAGTSGVLFWRAVHIKWCICVSELFWTTAKNSKVVLVVNNTHVFEMFLEPNYLVVSEKWVTAQLIPMTLQSYWSASVIPWDNSWYMQSTKCLGVLWTHYQYKFYNLILGCHC